VDRKKQNPKTKKFGKPKSAQEQRAYKVVENGPSGVFDEYRYARKVTGGRLAAASNFFKPAEWKYGVRCRWK